MNYKQFEIELEKLNIDNKEEINSFIKKIYINKDNFNEWVSNLFDNSEIKLNLDKLPYVIDQLYQSNDKMLFILCCMLIEATCEQIPFITNLENYPLFEAKFIELKHTLIDVYNHVDNGIANCMALIILNNDPKLEYFTIEEKNILKEASIRKIKDIINYLNNTKEIDDSIFNDLELIIDLAIYFKDDLITKLIMELDNYQLNYSCKLFIIKYKLVNEIEITNIEGMLNNKDEIERLVSIFEQNNKINMLPTDKISQESIARSNMIRWLEYPTELGKKPESIELLDELDYDGVICYIYRFKDSNFRIKDYMLGISGGYNKGMITAQDTGWTFSNFELVTDDYISQAKNMIVQIQEYWKNRNN